MGVKQRLIEFIKVLKIGQGAFEKEVGLSNGYVNNIRQSIQPDKLQRIALKYPQLNSGWLMTGEGEMLKPETRPVSVKETDKNALEMIRELSAENALLKREIEEMRKEKKNKAAALAVSGIE
jgi:hypothetical protein